ncbi:MAG: UDP-N-acetylmuramoyl-L-alanine--D-glutamate ligase [Verrucomicrobiota bacterium]|jgi:UDP-N-acetylmuramoylalanine--D-glutamate ligase
MLELENKQILVIGLGGRGQAACEFLRRSGAKVVGVDHANSHELRRGADRLRPLGIEVALGVSAPPEREFSLAILSSALPTNTPLVEAVLRNKVPLISELELGFQQSQCLSIAVAGTNGKGTTAELVERVLLHNHRKTVLSGHRARPVCSVIEQTKELDYLILQIDSFQLGITEVLRPSVAVLTNLAPDHLDRYGSVEACVRANARLFRNQQALDWAIVQSEALKRLRELNLPVPAQVITFSAEDRNADLYLDRGLLLSRIPNWSGPLLDLQHCQLRGPHNAENLMAALAVSHVLRLPLEAVADPMKTYAAGPHRFEFVAEINGVQFINDSKATNVDALHKTIRATRPGPGGEPNLWLIAGGKDKGLEFYDVGPLLSKRVKRAFLVGEASERIRAAWDLFTPCNVASSLLEAVAEAAKNATSGDVVLLAPACSSWDQFRNHQHRGEVFCQAVKSIGRGVRGGTPNIDGKTVTAQQ